MPAPQVRATTSQWYSAPVGDATKSIPVPAGTQEGDLLLLFLARSTYHHNIAFLVIDSRFTLVHTGIATLLTDPNQSPPSGYGVGYAAAYKWADGTETSVTFASREYDAPDLWAVCVAVSSARSVRSSSVVEVFTQSVQTNAISVIDPSLTFAAVSIGRNTAIDFGADTIGPAGWTERFDGAPQGYANGARSSLAVYTRNATTAATVAPSFTVDDAASWGRVGALIEVAGNRPPNAPTLVAPADGAILNRQQSQTFQWQFNDPDPGDGQSAYNLAYRLSGAVTWTETGWVDVTSSRHVFAAGALTEGDYEWRVQTKDDRGEPSPWSTTGFFTANTPPPGPSITAPANNETISTPEYVVTWSTPDQDAYRLRILDGTTVVYDTGQVNSSGQRSRTVTFDNDTSPTIEVTVLFGGLWSPAATAAVTVAFTQPPAATVTVITDDAIGALSVTASHPAPTGTEPTVTGMDVWIRELGDAGDGFRLAADVPPSQAVRWWLPASGVEYEARVRTIGDTGASTWSAWTGAETPVLPYSYGGGYA